MNDQQERLAHALATLRRAAEHGYLYPIYPAEAAALVAEVERLRADRLREGEDGYRQGHSDGCEDERAAVVAWLRNEYDTDSARNAADEIERGEHRRRGNHD